MADNKEDIGRYKGGGYQKVEIKAQCGKAIRPAPKGVQRTAENRIHIFGTKECVKTDEGETAKAPYKRKKGTNQKQGKRG